MKNGSEGLTNADWESAAIAAEQQPALGSLQNPWVEGNRRVHELAERARQRGEPGV